MINYNKNKKHYEAEVVQIQNVYTSFTAQQNKKNKL